MLEMLFFLGDVGMSVAVWLRHIHRYRPICYNGVSVILDRPIFECHAKDLLCTMAKSKQAVTTSDTKQANAKGVPANTGIQPMAVSPTSNVYKPLPRFRGGCKNC